MRTSKYRVGTLHGEFSLPGLYYMSSRVGGTKGSPRSWRDSWLSWAMDPAY